MIIFLYGEDHFRIHEKMIELKNKYLREIDPTGSDFSFLDGEKLKIENIKQAIEPSALFSKKRMVVLENIFLNKDAELMLWLVGQIKKIEAEKESNIIIFKDGPINEKKLDKAKAQLFKILAAQKYSHHFRPFSPAEIIKWANSKAERSGFRIRRDAAEQLVAAVGNDLWRLNNELEKIFAYKLSGAESSANKIRVITAEDIALLVRGKVESGIFALTDALGSQNKKLAISLLKDQVDSGIQENYLLAMIVRQYKILLRVKTALDQGMSSRKIISYLKLHPFVVQKCLMQVKKYSDASLKNILGKLIELDWRSKKGTGEIYADLAVLIYSL